MSEKKHYKYPWQEREEARKKQTKEVPRFRDKLPARTKPLAKSKKPLAKPTKPIAKRSKAGKTNDRIYERLRKDYLLDHPQCEAGAPGCTGESNQIHHQKGRGALLTEVAYFLATCDSCHKYIEKHPAEAKANGWSLPRNGTREELKK